METKRPAFYSVILAGGRGERLWPYSRPSCPKQLLKLSGDKTLLEHTVDRCRLFSDHVWVVTSKEFYKQIVDCVGSSVDNILVEPHARNTGPAIALALNYLHQKDPGADVGFFPSDHYIPDLSFFKSSINQAAVYAQQTQTISLLGLWPTRAATEYGYIEADCSEGEPSRVVAFYEKPDKQTAEHYIRDKNKFWNLGIFIASLEVFIQEMRLHALETYGAIQNYCESHNDAIYQAIPSLSIDYLLMEKSKNLSIVPVSFSWSDIGNLTDFMRIKKELGVSEAFVSINAHNNLVDVKGRLVALVGIDDVCIIEQGNILIIVKKDQADSISLVRRILSSKMSFL